MKATAIDNRSPAPLAEPKDKKPSGFKAVIGKMKIAKRPADEAAPETPAIPDQAPRPPEQPAIQLFPAISRTTSQIGGLVAAAVGKAIAALGQIANEVAAAERPQAPVAPDVTPQIPFTPLEQAVHDLISQLHTEDKPAEKPVATAMHTPEIAIAPKLDAKPDRPEPIAPIKELQPPSELPQVTSHVHLVLDDGPERVVMTVAVRGSEVNVALRGNHEATAAALARNAASLDHALRARGLDLTDFSAERDPDARRSPQHERREREQPSEQFDLEEHA